MRTHAALLLLGGNLGPVANNFTRARRLLEEFGHISSVSGLYRSEAWGMHSAPDFLNQALVLETEMAAPELLASSLQVEHRLGRERDAAAGYQSRTLDIDILLYDDLIIETDFLRVPHPRMHERRFTLMPAAEVAGNWRHPGLGKTIAHLLEECTDDLVVEAL